MVMRAAVYCRKSTRQRGVSDDAKSVVRQEELARAFAERQGWTVEHVFVDDGISGAEFERRPGFQQMLAAAKRRQFQMLIVEDDSRVGREMIETGHTLKQLKQHGVTVFEYLKGERLTPTNPEKKDMTALR